MQKEPLSFERLAHPYASLVQTYLSELRSQTEPFSSSGLTRDSYLELIDGIVAFFRNHQDESGGIPDPVTHRETYYSTPCFALGAALLAKNGKSEYLEPATKAMLRACQALAAGEAPDRHADFFTIFLMKADGLLRDMAAPEARDRWQADLRRIDPYQIYLFQKERQPEERIHNWNAINLTGEFLRYQAGLGGDPDYWESHLPYHMARFLPNGLYRDGDLKGTSHPLAYDAVTRYHLSVMMDAGYAGKFSEQLAETLLRGAITALFVQSPVGEWPGTGRSAHHTWNDAALAACYEWAAHQLAGSDPELAQACKRGARLALQAIKPFQRPGGELNILRNRFEPEERHGFEIYSMHATYNLWAAAALSIAYLLADETIPEAPLPSERMGYALDLDAELHQIIAANHGFYILVDGCGDSHTNPTGLVRINRVGVNAQIGPSEGAVKDPRFSVLGPKAALGYAPAWKDRLGGWHSLAEYGTNQERLKPTWRSGAVVDDDAVQLEITWRGGLDGCKVIQAVYRVTSQGVRIRYALQGQITGVRAEIPLFAFDGQEEAQITQEDDRLCARFRGSEVQVSAVSANAKLVLSEEYAATRTGILRKAWAETAANEIEIEVRLK